MVLFLLALGLAMDSVALSLANGAKNPNLPFSHAFRIAFVFGAFQALMPLLGYALGLSFVEFIARFDHFIAFGILVFLGVNMLKESREEQEQNLEKLSLAQLLIGAVATSIDALAVGVTFSFEQVDIFYCCAVIGVVCFALCVIACYVGRFFGAFLGQKALVLGGLILIFIGCEILYSHLMAE